MSDHKHDHDHQADPALDALLRAAAMPDDRVEFPVDENELLAYLNGDLDEARADEIREALAASPTLRGELMAMAADLRQLEEVAAEAGATEDPWAHVKERSAEPIRTGWFESLRGLLCKPAFAYTFMLLVLAFPAYRLVTGSGDEGPLLQPVRSLNLESGELIVRSDSDPAPPRVTIAPGSSIVALTLWSSRPYAAGERLDVAVLVADRAVWRTDDLPLAIDPDDPYRLDLRLDAGRLGRGGIAIVVTRHARATGVEIAAERYEFVLE